MGPLRLISLKGSRGTWRVVSGRSLLVALLCWGGGGGRVVWREDTSSLVNGLWGNRSPSVVTKAGK